MPTVIRFTHAEREDGNQLIREGEITALDDYAEAIPAELLVAPEMQFMKYEEAERLPPVLGLSQTYYVLKYKVVFEDKYIGWAGM